ncbi:MAG TPA: ABC transporter permease, partial [Candidatus Acidoferrum sp.]|nr:ABC transporter permease [Candidatus Acidoferrum sp.]
MIFRNLYYSWRFLAQNPLFTLINVIGLVIGITGALFIFIYVSAETSYDRFHRDYQDIYRVIGIDSALGVSSNNVGITMSPLGPAMEQSIPGVEKTVRIRSQGATFVTVGDSKFDVNRVAFTDNAFFEVFGFSLLQRKDAALLNRPHAAVVTREFAARLFGNAPALGKVLRFNDQDLEVVGIMADNRPDSHMQFELLVGLNY